MMRPRPVESTPTDPFRVPPTIHAAVVGPTLTEGGVDGAQIRLIVRATERGAGVPRSRRTERPAKSS
jgi:hypothetical protein